jgi:hypothetical protein
MSYGRFKRILFRMAEQRRSLVERCAIELCSAWKKWIRNPTTHPSSLWRRCNETMKRELRARSDEEVKTACSTILLKLAANCCTSLRGGWSVVRNASLSKGGTLENRPSLHLHKVPTRNNKVNPRIFQTVLVITRKTRYILRMVLLTPWQSCNGCCS